MPDTRRRPAFGGAAVEQEGPLTPCVQTPGGAGGGAAAQAQPWGIEIATAFSKEEAIEEFDHVKQDHADILVSYDPHRAVRPAHGHQGAIFGQDRGG